MDALLHNELISVVLPVYNSERYVREAIDSILNQSYTQFELLLINDGSTDTSEQIILSYTDARIVYLKNETNLGLIESLNKGIAAAKGGYIARMDADDIALPERLQHQLNAFKTDAGLIAAGTDYYVIGATESAAITNNRNSGFIKTCLLFAPYFNHPTMMIKNKFKELNLAYDKHFVHAEDYRLWTELALHGKFTVVDKPLLKYRSHGSQISALHKAAQLQISARIRREYMQRLGFTFSEEQFAIHTVIANNEFIRSTETLGAIKSWLENLVEQNNALKVIEPAEFKQAIHKFWLDSCGYTSLGLTAFKMYTQSPLAQGSFSDTIKLLGKCVVRKFKR